MALVLLSFSQVGGSLGVVVRRGWPEHDACGWCVCSDGNGRGVWWLILGRRCGVSDAGVDASIIVVMHRTPN